LASRGCEPQESSQPDRQTNMKGGDPDTPSTGMFASDSTTALVCASGGKILRWKSIIKKYRDDIEGMTLTVAFYHDINSNNCFIIFTIIIIIILQLEIFLSLSLSLSLSPFLSLFFFFFTSIINFYCKNKLKNIIKNFFIRIIN